MHSEPLIPIFVFIMLGILVVAVILKKLNQPHVVAYLLAGILLGPYGLKIIEDQDVLARLGEIGVILLLFFAGMEVSPRKFAKNWVVPVIGTTLQIFVTILFVWIVGWFMEWSVAKVVLFGSIMSLSSTAVVLKLIQDWGQTKTRLGENVLGVLLVQDLAVVPMLIAIGTLGGHSPTGGQIMLQVIGGVLVLILAVWMAIKDTIKLPFIHLIKDDHEIQVFAALAICFGMAAITGFLGLSSALGAFVAGMIVATAKEIEWVHHSLLTVKTLFLALFFISVGMLIDLKLIWEHVFLLTSLLIIVYLTNTFINALILKVLKQNWETSLYGGAMLSQIGEFSFVLITMGFTLDIISVKYYQFGIALISLSLLFSPLWIVLVKKYITKQSSRTNPIKARFSRKKKDINYLDTN